MKHSVGFVILLLAGSLAFGLAFADPQEKGEQQGMPPMGAPDEIRELAGWVGTWDVWSDMRPDSTADFTPMKGEARFTHLAGGACLQMTYDGIYQGMEFHGVATTTYNRVTGEWTQTWVDNIGGYLSVYRGEKAEGNLVLRGKDYMEGETWLTRITISDMTDSSYNWTLEHSRDDGRTWAVYMKSEYTKRTE